MWCRSPDASLDRLQDPSACLLLRPRAASLNEPACTCPCVHSSPNSPASKKPCCCTTTAAKDDPAPNASSPTATPPRRPYTTSSPSTATPQPADQHARTW